MRRFAALTALTSALFLAGSLAVSGQGRVVDVLTVASAIDPISARYISRGLDRAAREKAELVVIELDTPGGLGSSMDDIVAKILASPVPVAVYVSPPGARAASAGVFVTMAAHIAAMAPGTHIGAAHPVTSNGSDIPGVMGQKVLNDSVAKLKALADLRGRPASWADDAVRSSRSITDTEAAARGVVDLLAPSLGDLLAKLDGRTVKMPSGPVTLHTLGAEVRRIPPTFMDSVLAFLVNPDIAYILLVVGIFGIIFELTSPGAIAPGVAGALALLLSFIGFGNLPTNVGGIVFIVLAVVLFIVDIKAPTHGILTAGGVVAFVLGSFLLFPPWRSPAPPGPLPAVPALAPTPVTISVFVIIIMTVLVAGFFIFVLGKGILAQARKVAFGVESLAGRTGTVVTALSPEGLVQMAGEQWSARSVEGEVAPGQSVEVVGRDGLRLLVRRKGGPR